VSDTAVDPFDEPGSKGGGSFPHISQFKERLIIFKPVNLEKNIPGIEKGKLVDRMSVDIHMLDGEPITELVDGYGEPKDVELEAPFTAPHVFESMYVSQVVLVNQLRKAYKNDGMVLGRLGRDKPRQKGQQGAWTIEAASDEDKVLARDYWTKYLAEQKNSDPWEK
jgi:hypothetical protein